VILVTFDSPGGIEQRADLHERGDTSVERHVFAAAPEAKRARTRFV
jgi:hypothetical protein